jgi:hypothetical protein
LPTKHTRYESLASSSPVNIVDNLPETRIPPTDLGWFLHCRQARNLPKTYFLSGYVLWSRGGQHPISKAFGRYQHLIIDRQKPAIGSVNPLDLPLIPLTSLLSAFYRIIRPTPTFISFLTLKTLFFAIAKAFENLHIFPSCAEL